MNQQQRNYLVEKITETHKAIIRALEDSKETKPKLENHIYMAIMKGELRLKSEEEIIAVLKKRALAAKEGSEWLTKSRGSFFSFEGGCVAFEANDILVFPETFQKELDRVNAKNAAIEEEIRNEVAKFNVLEMRIKLASDKVLQTMINEIDDMGNLSLMDTKIKQIGTNN